MLALSGGTKPPPCVFQRTIQPTSHTRQSGQSPSSNPRLHTVYAFLPRHHDWGACFRAEYGRAVENKKAVKTDPGGKTPQLLADALPQSGSGSDLTALLASVSTPCNLIQILSTGLTTCQLKSDTVSHLAPRGGIEPPTNWLTANCTTAVLSRNVW